MAKILQFGALDANESYRDRPGSYAVIEKEAKVLLVKIMGWGKYFLPGGGIDEGESAMQALHREVGEETGFLVNILDKIGHANEYIYSPKVGGMVNKIGVFYTAEVVKEDLSLKIEADHQVEWHSVEEAIELLYLNCDKWAVRKVYEAVEHEK